MNNKKSVVLQMLDKSIEQMVKIGSNKEEIKKLYFQRQRYAKAHSVYNKPLPESINKYIKENQ